MRQSLRPWAFATVISALFVIGAVLFFALVGDRAPRGVIGSTPAAAPDRDSAGPESRARTSESRIAAVASIRPKSDTLRAGIRGRVVDEDGAAIAGATITFEESDGPEAVAVRSPILQLRSDRDGRFEAANLDVPSCDLIAEASGFGWRAFREIRTRPDGMVEVTLVLAPRPERLGRIVDAVDEGVEDAEVTINYGHAAVFGFRRSGRRAACKSGPGGWFSFSGAWDRDLASLRIRAHKSGVGAGGASGSALEDHEILTVKLLRVRTLTCRFVPEDGSAPPPGLKFGARCDDFEFAATADGSGVGTIRDVIATEKIVIEVDDSIWRVPEKSISFEVAPADDIQISVPLARTTMLKGGTFHYRVPTSQLVVQVLGPDGRAARDVIVQVADADGGGELPVSATTDVAGQATFESLACGRALISVDPASLPPGVGVDDDFQFQTVQRLQGIYPPFGTRTPLVLQLRPEVVFRGVVKLEDGTPVEGTITFSRDGRVRFGRTNAQGEFTLRMRSTFDYKLFEISRVVVPTGSDHPVLERFVPLERLPLKPDGETTIVVEPRS